VLKSTELMRLIKAFEDIVVAVIDEFQGRIVKKMGDAILAYFKSPVGATAAALGGFTVPVVLIAGGDGKGQDFSPLREAVRNARVVVQIGRDGPLVANAIAGACPVVRAETMAEAVQRAFDLSEPGDAVLLSPACASWDMFRNYAHRSEVFIAAVQALKADQEASRVQ